MVDLTWINFFIHYNLKISVWLIKQSGKHKQVWGKSQAQYVI